MPFRVKKISLYLNKKRLFKNIYLNKLQGNPVAVVFYTHGVQNDMRISRDSVLSICIDDITQIEVKPNALIVHCYIEACKFTGSNKRTVNLYKKCKTYYFDFIPHLHK